MPLPCAAQTGTHAAATAAVNTTSVAVRFTSSTSLLVPRPAEHRQRGPSYARSRVVSNQGKPHIAAADLLW